MVFFLHSQADRKGEYTQNNQRAKEAKKNQKEKENTIKSPAAKRSRRTFSF